MKLRVNFFQYAKELKLNCGFCSDLRIPRDVMHLL